MFYCLSTQGFTATPAADRGELGAQHVAAVVCPLHGQGGGREPR